MTKQVMHPSLTYLCILLSLLVTCQGTHHHHQPHRRHLQQQQILDTNSTTQVISSGGMIVQGCSLVENTYLHATPQQVVLNAADNIVPSTNECCRSCFNTIGCSAWVYCTATDGCSLVSSDYTENPAVTEAAQTIVPYHGCQLLALGDFGFDLLSSTLGRTVGPHIEFTSGSIWPVALQKIDKYRTIPGSNLAGYDYQCEQTLKEGVCQMKGSPQQLADACNADENCRGFTYYLRTSSNIEDSQLGWLKGGEGTSEISPEAIEQDATIVLYVKDSESNSAPLSSTQSNVLIDASNMPNSISDDGTGGSSAAANSETNSTSTNCSSSDSSLSILWIALPAAAALALAFTAGVILFIFLTKRRDAQAELARLQQSRNNSDGGKHDCCGNTQCVVSPSLSKTSRGLRVVIDSAPAAKDEDGSNKGGKEHQQQVYTCKCCGQIKMNEHVAQAVYNAVLDKRQKRKQVQGGGQNGASTSGTPSPPGSSSDGASTSKWNSADSE